MICEPAKVTLALAADTNPKTDKPCVKMGMYLVADKDDDSKGFTILMDQREMVSFILALVEISAATWGVSVVEIVNEPKRGFSPN